MYAATKTVRESMLPLSLSLVQQFLKNLGQSTKFYLNVQRRIENPYRPFGPVQAIVRYNEQDNTSTRQGDKNLKNNAINLSKIAVACITKMLIRSGLFC